MSLVVSSKPWQASRLPNAVSTTCTGAFKHRRGELPIALKLRGC